ncbi:MAG: 3-hydroxy-5-methyl-1-naphthoate 3-O-methyltransferase [Candidatus Dichloromethanomonas elyunquensis]|nr:MAG: 3-hydroxy-5-methyl-1-naphthoate 3-O-methyltransferase [Candidatus Dichloromethanomonas elyunquensis]
MHDPQDMNPQYLEDLAIGYWYSEVLFTAVEQGLFTRLEPGGKLVAELAKELNYESGCLKRYLHVLSNLGLVFEADGYCTNTKLSRKYLIQGAEAYQGDTILWRKYLIENWQSLDQCLNKGTRVVLPPIGEPDEAVKQRFRHYCRAMDCIVKNKIEEILPIFSKLKLQGEILDVGSGLGAFSVGFLRQFPGTKATLLDLPQVLEYAEEIHTGGAYAARIQYWPANMLESWELSEKKYSLVILSNIIHAFAESESGHVISEAAARLAEDGLLLVHDFFLEHDPDKAALSDLNMLVNTYNGKVYTASWVQQQLRYAGLTVTERIPLGSDTAVLLAAKQAERLEDLGISVLQQLSVKIQTLGFQTVQPIDVNLIHIPDWVGLKCEFGCDGYNLSHCPPNSIRPEKTRAILRDYTKCLLLQGTPPTRDFQRMVLQAEHTAFKAGYYKAFSFWAGPCSICPECAGSGNCNNHKNARPSMESAGIDVFKTIQRAGLTLKTLPEKDDYIKYFALLLLE